MKLHLIAVGTRMPDWVTAGFEEYARRLPRHLDLKLIEVPAAVRTKTGDVDKARKEEGARLLRKVPVNSRVVALDEAGTRLGTRRLAAAVEEWMGDGHDAAFLVGGADGLSTACRDRADEDPGEEPLRYSGLETDPELQLFSSSPATSGRA